MTLESLIAEARARGLRVNNLFQLDDGMWQANLRDVKGTYFNFGEGPTPEIALNNALAKAPIAEGEEMLA